MNVANEYERGEELLSPREALELLPRVSYQALLSWARAGKVPYVEYPSGRKFFRRSDIEALLAPVGVSAPSASSPASAV